MKGLLKSKPFIIIALVFSVVGILVVCIYFNIDRGEAFVPDGDVSTPVVDSWSEAQPTASGAEDMSEDDLDAFPKVVAEDEESVKVDFAPVDTSGTEPPPPPATSQDNTDPANPPAYTEEEIAPPSSGGPVPGSTNDQGQIYDPVFGWITPGAGNGVPVDNGGDPDKQVGDM